MSPGEVAGLIVAVAWAVLVLFLAFVLIRLAGTLKELTRVVGDVGDSTVPVLTEVTTTVTTTNIALGSVEEIAGNVSSITRNAKALTSIATSGLGGPLIRIVSFSYGVRRAMGGKKARERQRRVREQMRSEAHSRRSRARKASKKAARARKRAKR